MKLADYDGNWNALTPREKDALVAEAMGCCVRWVEDEPLCGCNRLEHQYPPHGDALCCRVWHYSTEIEQAYEALLWMRKQGVAYQLQATMQRLATEYYGLKVGPMLECCYWWSYADWPDVISQAIVEASRVEEE